MSILTAAQVEADVNYLMESLDVNKRLIPSASELLKKSTAIPLLAIVLSFFSTILFYVSSEWNEKTIAGFFHFFTNEAWVVVAPCVVIGLVFIVFSYNQLMMYLSVPEDVRNTSFILNHLRKVTSRVGSTFIGLMICAVFLTPLSPWFACAIPGLLFALIFAVGFIVGGEINRLGTGMALEKISNLLKKI